MSGIVPIQIRLGFEMVAESGRRLTEPRVPFDPRLGFHPGDGSGKEVPDLAFGALIATVEVLASELGDPNVAVKGIVQVGLIFA